MFYTPGAEIQMYPDGLQMARYKGMNRSPAADMAGRGGGSAESGRLVVLGSVLDQFSRWSHMWLDIDIPKTRGRTLNVVGFFFFFFGGGGGGWGVAFNKNL